MVIRGKIISNRFENQEQGILFEEVICKPHTNLFQFNIIKRHCSIDDKINSTVTLTKNNPITDLEVLRILNFVKEIEVIGKVIIEIWNDKVHEKEREVPVFVFRLGRRHIQYGENKFESVNALLMLKKMFELTRVIFEKVIK